MNVPAIAKQTFEVLQSRPEFLSITQSVREHLGKIKNQLERARFAHNVVDEYNREVFSHPLLKQLVPCKGGCSACCHTQVSVTEDEANLLLYNIDEGVKIDLEKLSKQASAGNDVIEFYKLSYADRSCIFLDQNGACQVYKDRPMVCRTNAVVGDAAQCDTDNGNQASLRLVKTEKADMAIVAAYSLGESGTLPLMIKKLLDERHAQSSSNILKTFFKQLKSTKAIFKDFEL